MQITRQSAEGIELETAADPDACVIWLHGLGADAGDFVPMVPQLQLPVDMAVRFIFPNAPEIPITINQGYRMPGWYDITSLELVDRDEDAAGVLASCDSIARVIDAQRESGIRADRIVIAGFSQGGAIALALGLRYPEKLAGIMALSTYLPAVAPLKDSPHQRLNIFMAHGTEDEVVKYKYGKMSENELISHEHAVKWHSYAMPHSVCQDEVSAISAWLQQTLT